MLTVHPAWMESIAIHAIAWWDSLDRIVKRVGVRQTIFISAASSNFFIIAFEIHSQTLGIVGATHAQTLHLVWMDL